MKTKWYLSTWFIALMFALWFLVIPAIIGVILLVLHYKQYFAIKQKYGAIDNLDNEIAGLEAQKKEQVAANQNLSAETTRLKREIVDCKNEINSLEKEAVIGHYNYSDYSALTSAQCKDHLALIKNDEKYALQAGTLVSCSSSLNKKVATNLTKKILRDMNAECDNILLNLTVSNIDSSRNKLTRSFETINALYKNDGISMSKQLLDYKLKELNLTYTYAKKKEEEREIQKAIREQMIEEEKVRKEIERQKAKIAKDQQQFQNEINRTMKYMQNSTNDAEKQLYIDKIRELQDKVTALEAEKKDVLDREANARAGYVYVISNIGSFGDDTYKIGMTRRLEPMDRIDELSSASVPFPFDVHAMIFSEDAPALESKLHQVFDKQRVNRVNTRKEFFRVSLDKIEKVVKENFDGTATFTEIPVAEQFHETQEIVRKEMIGEV